MQICASVTQCYATAPEETKLDMCCSSAIDRFAGGHSSATVGRVHCNAIRATATLTSGMHGQRDFCGCYHALVGVAALASLFGSVTPLLHASPTHLPPDSLICQCRGQLAGSVKAFASYIRLHQSSVVIIEGNVFTQGCASRIIRSLTLDQQGAPALWHGTRMTAHSSTPPSIV
jgi:hypothetical protein